MFFYSLGDVAMSMESPRLPKEIHQVGSSPFSIARYYGGMRLHGHQYIYDPTTDRLVRADVWKAQRRDAVRHAAEEKAQWKAAQHQLL